MAGGVFDASNIPHVITGLVPVISIEKVQRFK
jgi:hypothetical protein